MESGVWIELSLSMVVLMACALLGGLILHLCRIGGRWLVAGMAFPLGLGLTAWVWFLLSWAGVPLNRESLLGTWAALAVLGIAVASLTRAIRHAAPDARESAPRSCTAADVAVAVFLVALLLFSGGLSVGRSYSGWDDMSAYAAQGYAMARQGSLLAVGEAGPSARGYPINVPLAIAAFRVLGLEDLPGSKLIFPFLLASLLAACYGFWRKWRVPPFLATLGVIALGTAPTVFEHSTLGYTNLPAAVFATLGILCAAEGMEMNHRGTLAASGLLLGICAFTRPEGLLIALAVLACCVVVWSAFRRRWRPVLFTLWLLSLVAIPWMVYAGLHGLRTQIPEASTSAIDQVMQGRLHLDAVYWTLRFLVRSAVKTLAWGTLPLFVAALLLLGVRKAQWRGDARAVCVLAAGLGAGIATVAFYYLVSFGGDVQFWLGTGVERMFLPAVMISCAGIVGLTGAENPHLAAAEGSP
jgi:ABC-type proline/glycine betaine transport system permease subunit